MRFSTYIITYAFNLIVNIHKIIMNKIIIIKSNEKVINYDVLASFSVFRFLRKINDLGIETRRRKC